MVLPPTVVGYGLLLFFGNHGPMGKLLLHFDATVVFSWWATVITAVIMSFPLMYITARGAFEQVEPNIQDAARTLGASEWRVFWTVTLPLAWPGWPPARCWHWRALWGSSAPRLCWPAISRAGRPPYR